MSRACSTHRRDKKFT